MANKLLTQGELTDRIIDAIDSKQEPVAKRRLPPNAGKGRAAGTPNKTTKTLKEAILKAAELSGRDQKGKEGLVGYLRRVADEDVKAFSGLLGKVLPLQVTGEDGGPVQIARIELVAVSANPAS
jgi:hypothetical protein